MLSTMLPMAAASSPFPMAWNDLASALTWCACNYSKELQQ